MPVKKNKHPTSSWTRHLLLVSGTFNVVLLLVFIYWITQERPPNPYCTKRSSIEYTNVPLADQRGCSDVLLQLKDVPCGELIARLDDVKVIENGYAIRDLALASLVALYGFDVEKGFGVPEDHLEKRSLMWKSPQQDRLISFTLYPGISESQWRRLIEFARIEKWPFTCRGLFLQSLSFQPNIPKDLEEAFFLTPEFKSIHSLFSLILPPRDTLRLLLSGSWDLWSKNLEGSSSPKNPLENRRELLLGYLENGSAVAAEVLLQSDLEFAEKKITDLQLIRLFELLPSSNGNGCEFAKKILKNPRGIRAWESAAKWLYHFHGEKIKEPFNYQMALLRFLPEYKFSLDKKTDQKVHQKIVSKESKASDRVNKIKTNNSKELSSGSTVKSPPNFTKKTPPALKKIITKNNPPAAPPHRIYVVQGGDSLWKIARVHGVPVETIKQYNRLQTDDLSPGTILKIPTKHF